MTRTRAASAVLALGLALGGCSGHHKTTAGQPAAPASHLATPAGVGEVRLTAPPEHGAGTAPTFAWAPVPGADRYQLFVRDAQGRALWAWEGTGASVRMGGLSIDLPAGAAGPRLAPDATWLVLALGTDGKVRAVSAVRPASP